jgi:hypothetical protein
VPSTVSGSSPALRSGATLRAGARPPAIPALRALSLQVGTGLGTDRNGTSCIYVYGSGTEMPLPFPNEPRALALLTGGLLVRVQPGELQSPCAEARNATGRPWDMPCTGLCTPFRRGGFHG